MSNIEEYTKNFKFIIPEFNVATWHTEIKENFKAIDALIANFVQSQQYKGAWKQVTQYEIGDLVYISDEDSDYYGYLMRVKVNHITTGDDFDTFLANNPTYYEVQGEMGAQVAALRAQDWAEKTDGIVIINESPVDYSSKAYAIGGVGTETNNSKYFKEQAELARDTILQNPGFIAVSADLLGDENIKTVAESIQNVNIISDNLSSILTVYDNLSDINVCSSNINAILDAPTQATNAANSAQSAANSAALAYQYGNDKINQTHISNCITNIPQDIKLELNNGTLTLKAGSKVYVPNGSGVFDAVNISSDQTYSNSFNGTFLVFTTTSSILIRSISNCFSGAPGTIPTFSGTGAWYDTTNNLIKLSSDGGSTWTSGTYSLPIAIITISGGAISSIDQVFNGFGYIGSTVFALPGVKGLIPNGRNEDGTLKNIVLNVTSVLTRTFSGTTTVDIVIGNNYFAWNNVSYNENKNYNYSINDGVVVNYCNCGYFTISSGKISSLKPKTVFHSVDYSDFITQLDGKADIDLNNLSASGIAKFTAKLDANKIQQVSTLPASPVTGTLYLIPE